LQARRASISVNILFLSSDESAAGALGPRRVRVMSVDFDPSELRPLYPQ